MQSRKKSDLSAAGGKAQCSGPDWRGLAALSEDLFWELDGQGLLTWVDPKVETMLGLAPQDCLGRPIWELVLASQAPALRERLRACREEGRPMSGLVADFARADGGLVRLECRAAPHAGQGRGACLCGAARPLPEACEHHALLSALPQGVQELDAKGRITYANPALERMYGCAPGGLIGKHVHDLPAHQPARNRLKSFLAHLTKNQPEPTPYHELARRRDGSVFELRVDWQYKRDADGRMAGYVAILSDITEAVSDERELSASRARLATMVEGVGDPMLLAAFRPGGDHRVLEANRAMLALARLEPEMIFGRPLSEVLPGFRQGGPAERCREAFARRERVGFVWQADPESSPRQMDIYPVFDELGRAAHLVLLCREPLPAPLGIPERGALEPRLAQAQKMETMGLLAGGIAHDFNNILAAILGYTELAQARTREDQKVAGYLTEVRRAGDRARQLIQQILSFSRPGGEGKKCLNPVPLVKEVLKLMRSTLPATVGLEARVDNETGCVLADAGQLHQVLVNLMTNAAQSAGAGGMVSVRLGRARITPASAPAGLPAVDCLKLSVSDNGAGMDSAVRQRIFEPFFTTKPAGKGSGMGLTVVKSIVESHGGEIQVHSRPGQGACFTVFLPLHQGEAEAPAPSRRAAPRAPTGTERILFLDDEEPLVEIARAMLTRLGYRVTTATSPKEGLELFRRRPDEFDLVISDQTMPVMTGSQLASKMLTIRPDLPIIICTGYIGELSPEYIESLGVKKLMFKPLEVEEFASQVRQVLDQCRPEAAGPTMH